MHFYSTSHFQLIFSFYIFLTCLVVIYGCESWTIKKVSWTARRSNQSILKEISPGVHWKNWCWNWNSNTLTTWCEELTHLKRPWCWERLRAGGEGDNRGWDGWMALLTQWTWVWVNSRSWWWAGKPGVLRFMGLQRVGHDWATELNWLNMSSVRVVVSLGHLAFVMKEKLFTGNHPGFNGVEIQARIVCTGYLTVADKMDNRQRFAFFYSEKSENNSFSFTWSENGDDC